MKTVLDYIVEGCCSAFKQVNDLVKGYRENLFHLRDFVYFLRFLRKYGKRRVSDLYIDPRQILFAISRNFNGVPAEILSQIVDLFFKEIKAAERRSRDQHYKEFNFKEEKVSTLDILKESINDKVGEDEDPNQGYLFLFHSHFLMSK